MGVGARYYDLTLPNDVKRLVKETKEELEKSMGENEEQVVVLVDWSLNMTTINGKKLRVRIHAGAPPRQYRKSYELCYTVYINNKVYTRILCSRLGMDISECKVVFEREWDEVVGRER